MTIKRYPNYDNQTDEPSFSGKITKMEGKLDSLITTVAVIHQEVSNIKTYMEKMNGNVDEAIKAISNNNQDIAVLNSKMCNINKNMDNLSFWKNVNLTVSMIIAAILSAVGIRQGLG